jgi:hypothetical protein
VVAELDFFHDAEALPSESNRVAECDSRFGVETDRAAVDAQYDTALR